MNHGKDWAASELLYGQGVLPARGACAAAANADAANRSISTYLLMVGLGYKVTGILDNRRVEDLIRINGDLGRLGGLLKLWLTNDERTAAFGASTVLALLGKIEDNQNEMLQVIREVVIPKAKR